MILEVFEKIIFFTVSGDKNHFKIVVFLLDSTVESLNFKKKMSTFKNSNL